MPSNFLPGNEELFEIRIAYLGNVSRDSAVGIAIGYGLDD
jgi:hypothetical protein